MNILKLVMVAACVLLLGFDLARDGAQKIRLKRNVESQQQFLERLRIDLSTKRTINDALRFELARGDDLKQIADEGHESMAHLGGRFSGEPGASLTPITVREHLSAEGEGQGN
jgi:hypothetical protein